MKFLLYVNDTDVNASAYNPSFESAKVWFNVTNGTGLYRDGSNTTNASGYVEYNFEPSCSNPGYNVGPKDWFGYVSVDTCYKNSMSSTLNVTIIGDLAPDVTYPSGQTFYRQQYAYINITGSVKDECNFHYVPNATANFTVFSVAFPETHYECEDVYSQDNGTYNCTFNATSAVEGWYNVMFNVTNYPYYNNGTVFESNRFRLIQSWYPPLLENQTVEVEDDWGWGENFTFRVNVSDVNGDDVNVSLWISSDNSTWTFVNYSMCYNCGDKTEQEFYYRNFNCSDIGDWYFKFNATDSQNETEGSGINFNLTKDDVEIRYVGTSTGNNSAVNRSEQVFLKIRVFDTDKEVYVTGGHEGKTWITTDGISYDSGNLTTTDSSGYLNFTFVPNCSYSVGMQNWTAGIHNETSLGCYKNQNHTGVLRTTIYGWMNNSIESTAQGFYYSNQNVTLRGNVTDDCGINMTDADIELSVRHRSFTEQCLPIINETGDYDGYYNCTWNVSSNPSGWYNITMNSSKRYYNNQTTTDTDAFFHEVAPTLSSHNVNPSSASWGSTFRFNVTLTDQDDTVNVSLWVRCTDGNVTPNGCHAASTFQLLESENKTNYENQIVSYIHQYGDGSNIGNYEWFFNATDKYGNVSNTSVLTFSVTKRPVYITYIAGNDTNVSRIGTNTTMLRVRLYQLGVDGGADSPMNSYSVNFWVTTEGGAWSNIDKTGTMQNTTGYSGTGYAEYHFNPTCPATDSGKPFYKTGQRWWNVTFGGDTVPYVYYTKNSSTNFTLSINSTLKGNLIIPSGDYYEVGTNVYTLGNISDECEAVSGASTTFTVPGGTVVSCDNNTGPGGNYSCTLVTSVLPTGDYNETINSSKGYYEDLYVLYEDAFHLRNAPALTNEQIDPTSEGWGYNFTINVSAQTQNPGEGDYINISLWKSVGGDDWVKVQQQDCSPNTCVDSPQAFFYYPQFSCTDYSGGPNINFKFNATNKFNLTGETSNFSATFEQDDVLFTIVQGSGKKINRTDNVADSSFAFIVIVNDSDRNNVTVDYTEEPDNELNGTIWFSIESFGPTFDAGIPNTTGADGRLVAEFNPNCSYQAGLEYWKAGIHNNTCYETVNMSGTLPIYDLKGQLLTNITQPPQYSDFNVTQNITFKWHTYTDCYQQGGVDNGNVTVGDNTFNLYNVEYTSNCQDIFEEEGVAGSYNCTWNSTSEPEGNWTIELTSTLTSYNQNATNYTDWIYLNNTEANVSVFAVTPTYGGWGAVYTFNVTVTDPEFDTTTCLLYVNTTGDFVYRGYDTITPPDVCSVTVNDFTCADQTFPDNATYYFIINDTFNWVNTSQYPYSSAQGPNITKNNVELTRILPSEGQMVNRSSNQWKKFEIRVNDTTRNAAPLTGTNGTIWVTTDGQNYSSEFNVSTNTSGYFELIFNPNCTGPYYTADEQAWVSAVVNDECYATTYTNSTPEENYTINVYGDISITITQPNGEKYLRSSYPDGQNVTLKALVESDCSAETLNQSVTINFISTRESTNNYCDDIHNEMNGTYNCSVNTSSYAAKGWDVTVNATKDHYNYYTTTESCAPDTSPSGCSGSNEGYWVETKPVLQTSFYNQSHNPIGEWGDGGWGERWIFKVNFTDEDDDVATVRLWVNRSTGAWDNTFVTGMTNSSVSGINETVTFNVSWQSTEPGVGPHKFKFNVTENSVDFSQNKHEVGDGNFTLLEDDVIVYHVEGNNTTVNRTQGSQTLSLRVYDTDRGGWALGGQQARIYVTNDTNVDYQILSSPTLISGNGWLNASFNPDCTGPHYDVGPQNWTGGPTGGSTLYKATNHSGNLRINITAVKLTFNISTPQATVNFTKYPSPAQSIPIAINVWDECGGVPNANVDIVAERGSTTMNCSIGGHGGSGVQDLGNGTYNCTFSNSTIYSSGEWDYGYWDVSFHAIRDYYNTSDVEEETNAFYLASKPHFTSTSYSTSWGSYGWGDTWTFKANLEDLDYTGELGSTVNVSLWLNISGDWTHNGSKGCVPSVGNCTDQYLIFDNFNFLCNNIDSDYEFFKFNATDNLYPSDNRFMEDSQSTSFNITPDSTTTVLAGGSGSTLERKGLFTVKFEGQIFDVSKNYVKVSDQNVQGKLWVTVNSSDPTSFDFEESIQTDSDGDFEYEFDPNCTFNIGEQKWKMGVTDFCYYPSNFSAPFPVVRLRGQLMNELNQPTYGFTAGTGTLINITYTTKSDCSDVRADESQIVNATEGVTYPIRVRNPDDSTIEDCDPWTNAYNGSYNCTYNTTYHPPGWYDIILSSAKTNFTSNTSFYYNDWFNLQNVPPKYYNPQVTPNSSGWGGSYNFSVQIEDTDLDSVNCTLYVSTDGQTTWRVVNSTTIYGGSGVCTFNLTEPYACNDTFYDIGTNNYFRFNLTDEVGQKNSTTTAGPTINKHNISISYVAGNNTNVTRVDGTLPLGVYVEDLMRNEAVGSSTLSSQLRLSFNVTFNGTDYKFVGSNESYSYAPGYVNYTFDPDCEFNISQQVWEAFYNSTIIEPSNECYYYNETDDFYIGVVGQLMANLVSPNETVNQFTRVEENITWRSNVTTDCIAKDGWVSGADVTFKATHISTSGSYYCDNSVTDEGDGNYSCIFVNNASKPTRNYKLQVWAQNVSWYDDNTTEFTGLCTPTPCAFYVYTKPALSNPGVSYTQDGGWGETWQFDVTLTDDDEDTNTIKLWVRNTTPALGPLCLEAGSYPDFYEKDSKSAAAGNIQFTFSSPSAFSSACAGTSFEYFFNTTDAQNNATTGLNTFTVQKDDINITHISGNDTQLNRSLAPSSDNVTFSIRIYDTDRDALLTQGTQGTAKFYVTTDPSDPQSFVVEQTVTSIQSGHFVNHTFPKSTTRCNYDIGPQLWRAEFGSTSTSYKATNSSITYGSDFTITLYTHELKINVSRPDNETFRPGIDTITYIANVSDDCGAVVNADVEFNVDPSEISPSSDCSPGDVTDHNNGTYSCVKTPSNTWSLDWHDLISNASKTYYNNSQEGWLNDSFVIVTNPIVEMIAPSTKCNAAECLGGDDNYGWGETWNFTAIVQDVDQDSYGFEEMNITLWVDFGSGYQAINSTTCPGPLISSPTCGSPEPVTFLHRFDCGKIGEWPYKINVTDFWTYNNTSTSGNGNITINPDSVEIEYISAPQDIDRDVGSTTGNFMLRIKDVDNNTYLPVSRNASIYYTEDGNVFTLQHNVTTDSGGQISSLLNPNCTFSVGIQKWDGGTLNDKCYYSENLTQGLYGSTPPEFNISGQIKVNLLAPTDGSIFNVTEQVLIRFNTTSDCTAQRADEQPLIVNATNPVAEIELRSPNTTWQTCTPFYDEYDGWYNCTWDSTDEREGYWIINLTAGKMPNFNSNETMYVDWFELENYNITSQNTSIWIYNHTDSQWYEEIIGSWTRVYNYTIDVYDQEGDTVNCSLYVSTNNKGSWTYKDSSVIQGIPGTPTEGTCSVLVHDFGCADIDAGESNTKWYKWYIVNGEPANAYYTNETQGPNITESNTSIWMIETGPNVNRSSGINQTVEFAVRVFDTENNTYVNGSNVTFWVTHDNMDYQFDNKSLTNTSGETGYIFDPTCDYSVGLQYWLAGVTDSCYADRNTSSNFTTTIYGDLILIVTSPQGEKHLRADYSDGQNITMRSNVSSECSQEGLINNASVNFSSTQLSTTYHCTPVVNESNGYYNCSLNTSGHSARGWDVTMNASKEFYNSNSTTDAFNLYSKGYWVETKPVLTTDFSYQTYDYLGGSGDGGWGETWEFTVNATDEDGDIMEVKLWVNTTTAPDVFTQKGVNNTVNGTNITVTLALSPVFQPSEVLKPRRFKFNVSEVEDIFGNATTDFSQNKYQTDNSTFTPQKDDINFTIVEGNWTSVNRTLGDQRLSVLVFDTDKGSWAYQTSPSPPSARIYVTNDTGTNYILIGQSATRITSGGFINTTGSGFDPNCTFSVGPQKWKVNTTSDNTYYKAVDSADLLGEPYHINITTVWLQYVIKSPLDGLKFRRNPPSPIDNIPIFFNVSDECGLVDIDPNDIGLTATRGSIEKQCTDILGDGDYNCTFQNSTIDESWEYGYWDVNVNATKAYYNNSPTQTATNAFYMTSVPVLSLPFPYIYTTFGTNDWGDEWNFSVSVEDYDYTGENGSTINVSFWVNVSAGETYYGSKTCVRGVNCSSDDANGPVSFGVFEFACNRTYNDVGSRSFKFNVTDNFGYNASISQSFTITKDDTVIEDVYGNTSSIGREYEKYVRMSAQFTDLMEDVITDEYVNGTVWISTNDTFDYPVHIKTNASGYFNYDFDPDCNFLAGERWWKITLNDSCYDISESSNQSLEIHGQLKNNMIYPVEDQHIVVGEALNVTSNITTECNEIVAGATVTHEERSPNVDYNVLDPSPADDLANGYYNTSFDTIGHIGGDWGFRINASKDYYYSNSTTYVDRVYLNNTPPNYTSPAVSPAVEGWGVTYNFSIQINDTQNDNVSCTLYVSTDGQSTWKRLGNYTLFGGLGQCSINISTFNCSDIGDDNYFIWQLDDDTPENIQNITPVQGPNITTDDVTIAYMVGNESRVNRSDIFFNNVTLFVVEVNDTDRGVPANGTVTFYITKDGSSFLSDTNSTNATGHANYYFNPGCNYYPGLQYWKASVTDSCYVQQNITNKTVEVFGNITYIPRGYRQGESTDKTIMRSEQNLTLDAGNPDIMQFQAVRDDCGGDMDVDSITMEAVNNVTSSSYYCTEITNPSTGVYRCNMNTSSMDARWYDVVINTNKSYHVNTSLRTNGSFFIETKPSFKNITVRSSTGTDTGGWGEMFHFNVTVTDEDYDFVNLTLYVRRHGVSGWIEANSTDLESPVINETVHLSWRRATCEAAYNDKYPHDWEFTFNATDDANSPLPFEEFYETSTIPENFTIEKDNVTLQHMYGDGEWVWRNGTGHVNLSIKVIDTDYGNSSVASGVNGSFWVTTDSSNFAGQKITETDSLGNLTYGFPHLATGENNLPGGQDICDYSVGIQDWFGGVYDDLCYKDRNSTQDYVDNFTVRLDSRLSPNIVYPDGEGFLRGDPVSINSTVYDDCSYVENIDTVVYTFLPEYGSPYQCTISDNNGWSEGGGWYNCTKNTGGKPKGWYNVSIDVSETYYASNSTIKYNLFFLGDKPVLTNPRVDKSSGGWGETYVFAVTFTDADGNEDNVSLWKSYDDTNWILVEEKYPIKGISVNVEFTHKFNCSDYALQSPVFYYKFNATDPFDFTDETVSNNITLHRDNVSLTISDSSDQIVRRIGDNEAFLEFTIYDTDNGQNVTGANGTVYVTTDGSNYDVALNCTSSNSFCNAYHNPACNTTVGTQYWLGGTIEKDGFSCYHVKNSSASTLTVYGQLNVSMLYPYQNMVLTRGSVTELNSSASSECGDQITDANIYWYNSSGYQLSTDYNTTWSIPPAYKLGSGTISSNASRQYYDPNGNVTGVYIYGWSMVSEISPQNESSYSAGDEVLIFCRVIDSNNSQPLSGYGVKFYKEGVSIGNSSTNGTGYANATWYTTDESAGMYNITCSITDNTTLYYNDSVSQKITWLEINRPLIIDQIIRQHPTIYRNDSFDYYATNISVHVKDANIGDGDGANVTFYNSTDFIGNCTTNTTGECYLSNFNPPDTTSPQAYTIYINATRPQNEDSSTNTTVITVRGILYLNITSPPDYTNCGAGGLNCPKSNGINLEVTGTTENGENFTQIEPTVRWYNETVQIAIGDDTILPQSKVAEQVTGTHQFMAEATKSYYDSSSENVTLNITGLADVIWVSPTGIVPYPSMFRPTCFVKDHNKPAGQGGISDYVVNVSYKWEPSSQFIFNGSYVTNISGYVSYDFETAQKGNITFNCTIGDNMTQFYTKNQYVDVEELWIKDVEFPRIYNTSVIPNTSIEANMDYLDIIATVHDNYKIIGVWANITFPNSTNVTLIMKNITVPDSGYGYYNATYRNSTWTPPFDGVYNVTVYAVDDDPENNVNNTLVTNITVWGNVSGYVLQSPESIVAYNITQSQGYTFVISSNFTNPGPANIYFVNLTHQEDPAGSLSYNNTTIYCGNMSNGSMCNWTFEVTVPSATPPQFIMTYIVATWQNPDKTINTTSNQTQIIVSSNPVVDLSPPALTKTIPHDNKTDIGEVTTTSAGNDELRDVSLSHIGGNLDTECPLCTLYIVPDDYGLLVAGDSFQSEISIDVPAGQSPGLYWTKIRTSTSNAGFDESLLNLTISPNKTWTRFPETFGTIMMQLNTSGTIGNISTTNLGNVKIPLEVLESGNGSVFVTVYPAGTPGTTAFDLEKQTTRNVSVDYSVLASATQGIYNLNIIIRNATYADPPSLTTNVTLNITDLPPQITGVYIYPDVFEIGYENVTVRADVTDNFVVDTVWINVTRPDNSTLVQEMPRDFNDTYNTSYYSTMVGTHKIRICANDSRSLESCTSEYDVEGSETTTIDIIPNTTLILADNMTIYAGQSFGLNISLNNSGGSRANHTNLTITTPQNITSTFNFTQVGFIPKWGLKWNVTTISVIVNSTPGLYYINLSANWTNLNNTLGTSNETVNVNVSENQFIHSEPPYISKYIWPGTTENATLSLNSAGNVNATGISMNCSLGEVCRNFTLTFEPENITVMPLGNVTNVSVSIFVPGNYPSGIRTGTIRVLYGEGKYTDIPIDVTVPVNVSWSQQPTEIKRMVFGNTSGLFGEFNITNTGNTPMTLSISGNETVGPRLNLSHSQITLGYGESRIMNATYSAPTVYTDTNYTGYIRSEIIGDLAQNSSIKERSTYAELFVMSYRVEIVYPTNENPITGVDPGEEMTIRVNVTSNAAPVTTNVNFNVYVFNSTVSNGAGILSSQFNSSDSLWHVKVTAPSLSLARIYSLNVTANYTSLPGRFLSDVSEDSVVYTDTSSPYISISIPVRTVADAGVPIHVNITETGGINTSTFVMTYPNSSTANVSMQFVGTVGDTYLYSTNFTDTNALGQYTFTVNACDLSGNCNSVYDTFEIYPIYYFAGYTTDVESVAEDPFSAKFDFYDQGTTVLRTSFTSNSTTGFYNESLDAKSYDVTIKILNESFGHSVNLDSLAVSSDHYNAIKFGKIPRVRTTSSSLKGVYLDVTGLSPGTFTLNIDFSDCASEGCGVPIYDPKHLGIYKYSDDWTPKLTSSVNTEWTRLTNLNADNGDNTVNVTTLTASVNLTNPDGAYILAEFICGNGDCESDVGESTSNCPADCPFIPAPPTVEGGGGAGGAGGAAFPPTVSGITGEVIPPVPVEIMAKIIETVLKPGEEKILSVDVTNNMNNDSSVTVSIEGTVFSLLTVQTPTLTVPGRSTKVIKIKAYAPIGSVPGIYTGDIIVTAGDVIHRTPIQVKIDTVLEPLLDVKVKALSKTVQPGGALIFEVTLLNMGETATIEDITVTYNIRPTDDQSKLVATMKETLAVEDVITRKREIEIHDTTPEGSYVIEANASYWYGEKFALAYDDFNILFTPWPIMMLRAALLNWVTYVVIFVGIPAALIGYKWFLAWKASKKAKSRYVAPLDFKTLPRGGADAIPVGKIAETDVKSYVDISQLILHSIAAGGTGSGKSVSAMVCAEELLKRKVPVIVFDPTAQWTGFMRPCKLPAMLKLYSKFGLKPTDARSFKTNVILVDDPEMEIKIKEHMKPGEITVFVMNRLKPEVLDKFVRRTIQSIFDMRPAESKKLQLMVVYDEVHRLLPKYGGKGGYVALERACREFRKWGIAVFMISQVLLDFKGAIRANIANEIQLRTKYEGDIGRVKSKHGSDYASKVTKLTIGTGLFHNSEYNNGRPWFVSFRPLLHSPFALKDDEIDQYVKLNKKVEDIEKRLGTLKKKGVDTYDVEIELNIAKDKLKTAAFKMAETYLTTLEKRVVKLEK